MDVSVDAPGKRRLCTKPLILRHHAQHDPHTRQTIYDGGKPALALDFILSDFCHYHRYFDDSGKQRKPPIPVVRIDGCSAGGRTQ